MSNKFISNVALLLAIAAQAAPALAQSDGFLLHTGTALHETDDTFEFAVASNGDLFAFKKSNTGTRSTEVHVLSAASRYQTFSLQTGTALHETGSEFQVLLAPNRDVIAIKKSLTGSGSTEVHILEAASGYARFSLQTGTALHETDDTFEFALAANRDLFAIKKSNTGSGTTEVHVLSAASNYQQFVQQTGTALHETDDSFEFALAPNRDLFAIKQSNTGSSSTEVHVLSAGSGYQQFSLHTGTVLHETDDTFAFEVTNGRELLAIKQSLTGTQSTEVHIVDLPPLVSSTASATCSSLTIATQQSRCVRAGADGTVDLRLASSSPLWRGPYVQADEPEPNFCGPTAAKNFLSWYGADDDYDSLAGDMRANTWDTEAVFGAVVLAGPLVGCIEPICWGITTGLVSNSVVQAGTLPGHLLAALNARAPAGHVACLKDGDDSIENFRSSLAEGNPVVFLESGGASNLHWAVATGIYSSGGSFRVRVDNTSETSWNQFRERWSLAPVGSGALRGLLGTLFGLRPYTMIRWIDADLASGDRCP